MNSLIDQPRQAKLVVITRKYGNSGKSAATIFGTGLFGFAGPKYGFNTCNICLTVRYALHSLQFCVMSHGLLGILYPLGPSSSVLIC